MGDLHTGEADSYRCYVRDRNGRPRSGDRACDGGIILRWNELCCADRMEARVSCIEGMLRQFGKRIEAEARGASKAVAVGIFVPGYQPQVWNVKTDDGSASLTLDAKGRVLVAGGTAPAPDVTIEADHRWAAAALNGDQKAMREHKHEAQVTTHTSVGKATWALFRGRLGF